MQNHAGTNNYSMGSGPPIIAELEAIFEQLPDGDLLSQLQGPTRRGHPEVEVVAQQEE